MKKLLLTLTALIVLSGCMDRHECQIAALEYCGVDNLYFAYDGVFGECRYRCADYSVFLTDDSNENN